MPGPRWNRDPASSHRHLPQRPQLGVVERAGDYEVLAELPSSRPEDVTVRLDRGSLTIRARRADPPANPDEPAGWQVSLAFGDLVRGDAQIVQQGVLLMITLPKAGGTSSPGSDGDDQPGAPEQDDDLRGDPWPPDEDAWDRHGSDDPPPS
ncbi:MAG: Hsp20/alpha crystallin family protein [Planctomycetes bacterium]|nr:Hsp20/alpha crystallin family protein [Planctomycetota bacterium]